VDIQTLVIIWAVFGFVGGLIAQNRKLDLTTGVVLGVFLGPIGWVILLFQTPNRPIRRPSDPLTRECPYCRATIRADASVCMHCQRESKAWELKDGTWWYENDAGQRFYMGQGTWVKEGEEDPDGHVVPGFDRPMTKEEREERRRLRKEGR